MKNPSSNRAKIFPRGLFALIAAAVFFATDAHAGLTFELDVYVQSQGQSYVFYTPLFTNSTLPAAPLGSYFISSPHWPTNGSMRGFQLTASGLSDIYSADSEFGYGDFATAIQQITNGIWTILFTNNTTTNLYKFTVSAPNVNTNMLPPTAINFPADASSILTSQTNFTWQGPTNWPVHGDASVYDINGYYQYASLPAAQTSWNVDASLPAQTNYTFNLHYLTNFASPVFVATTPLSTNTLQPISGWATSNVLETGSSVSFTVVPSHGSAYQGHSLIAHYTFEDNNLFVHDFSGNGNNMSFAWFSVPPYIVTNDAAAGTYAGGFGGSGWFTPPDSLRSLFAGSFSVSLWLKTTNVLGADLADQYSAGGIVSDLSGNYNEAAMPMGQTGHKLAFYTGGSTQNILRSQTNINTGQYVHVVTTRDQQTGEKRIYVNGVLDSSVFASSDLLNGSGNGGLTIGYNNGNVFAGKMDEIEFYSGVLSSNDVAFLHSHPGTNVADTLELGVPVARYDFEQTNSPGTDSSGHNNNANCSSGNGGPNLDTYSTNSAVGSFARKFFGDTSICFSPGGQCFTSLTNVFYGSYSFTAWVKTTNSVNADYANAYFGAPILFSYSDATNQTVFSITGGKAAFTTGNPNGGSDTTLHSTTSVNDGNYHFLAATRNQTNGLMNLYVDGHLEATGTSTNGPRIMTATMYLAGGYYVNYVGLLDDVRVYSGVLGADDLATLSGHPSFNAALSTVGLPWISSGDTLWFTETTNTFLGSSSAAQSGSVTNSQISTLSVTVNGPGTLTFSWSSIANDPNQGLDYEFYVDDPNNNDLADLYGDNDWNQAGPFIIPAGQHTLGWIVYADGDTDPTQAAFLDQVNYVSSSPVTLLNPQVSGSNFQLQFLSQSGFNQSILYRTNLAVGNWQTWSNFTGDGTLKTFPIPLSIFNPSKQGFIRVSTQ